MSQLRLLPAILLLFPVWAILDPSVPSRTSGSSGSTLPVHHPHDVCSIVALPPNFPDDPTVFVASYGSMNLFLRSRNKGFGWKNTRSGMLGHQISDCAIAPDWARSLLIYVALGQEGLQRSSDGGTTWDPPLLTEPVSQVEVAGMVNGMRVVICGGGNRIWLSTDGGDKWSLATTTRDPILSIAIPSSFVEEPVVAVGTAGAIMVKLGADEWMQTPVTGGVKTIEFSPDFRHDRTIWAGTRERGMLESNDAGATFHEVPGLRTPFINDIVVAPTWPACRDMFAATPRDGVHASRDGGVTWQRLAMHVIETYQTDDHYQSLALSSRYPEDPTIYCGAYEGLYCSVDRGEHWFELNLNPTRIGRKIAISPAFADDGTVFMIGYGNPLSVTQNGGETWEFRSIGMSSMVGYSLSASPTYATDGLCIVGIGSGMRRTPDGGRTWQQIALKPVSPSAKIGSYETRQVAFSPDYAQDHNVFAVTAAGFYRSEDAGATWKGLPVPPDWTWQFAVAPDWRVSRTVLLGGYHVWRSGDGGANWDRIEYTGKVAGIVCAPDFATTGEAYLLSESRGLLRTRDHGRSWQGVAGALDGFSPTKLRLSPRFLEDQTMFAATVSGGVFRSTDRGSSWHRCAPLGGIIDACFDFVVSPAFASDQTMFACVYEGIVKSIDGGRSWVVTTSEELFDDMRDPWILRGSWTPLYRLGLFGVGAHRSRTAGSEAVLPFTGTAIRLMGTKGPDHGRCELLLDGISHGVIDCHAEQHGPTKVLAALDGLPQGFHIVTLRVLGDCSELASDTWVSIDAAIVRYSTEDDRNEVFSPLHPIYLGPDASFARDTVSQNADVEKGRQELRNAARLEAEPRRAPMSDAELRIQIQEVQTSIQRVAEEIDALRTRARAIDEALRAREPLSPGGQGKQ